VSRFLGLDWIGLDWIGLDWIGLDWIGLDLVGLRSRFNALEVFGWGLILLRLGSVFSFLGGRVD
jgi:hypothetical protein